MELYLDNPLFVIPIVTGPIFIFASTLMMIFPPKKINSLYGYRSSNSMKSQNKWDFAQKHSAKEMFKLGLILTLSSVIGLFLNLGNNLGSIIGIAMIMLAAILLISKTEKALESKFDK